MEGQAYSRKDRQTLALRASSRQGKAVGWALMRCWAGTQQGLQTGHPGRPRAPGVRHPC